MQTGLEKEYHSLSQLGEIRRLYNSAELGVREALFVATQLVNHGYRNASHVIEALRIRIPQQSAQEYLGRLEQRLAAIHALPDLAATLADEQAVRSLYGTAGHVFRPGTFRSHVAVVIFTSKFNNYHISNLVFDALLSQLGVARLFLKDTTASIYFRGVEGLAGQLPELPGAINTVLEQHGCSQAIITGFSSGGYAALYTALKMEHIGFTGFSVSTDVSAASKLPVMNLYNAQRGVVPDICFQDTRPLFDQRTATCPYLLFYGEKEALDRAHALHLSGLENVTVTSVANAGHQVTSTLMERNELILPFAEILQAAGV